MQFTTSEVPILNNYSQDEQISVPDSHSELIKFINESDKFKPKSLKIKPTKWKYLIRTIVRGKNLLIVGHSGIGKTTVALCAQNILNRPKFILNMGAMQDPRVSLIGTTHFNKDSGTFFKKSYFVEAITTPNSIILLDELSRAHPDAWNILLPVLDMNQRYLRLDEDESHPTIKVANGVSFLSTANVGAEYTSTRTMDKSLIERFQVLEMDILSKDEELDLLKYMYPSVSLSVLSIIASISEGAKTEFLSDNPRISKMVSTRMAVEAAGLIWDGFDIMDAMELCIHPFFSNENGSESERAFIKQLSQKYISSGGVPDDLFGPDDLNNAF